MGLQAQAPLRMGQTIAKCGCRILLLGRVVERLKEEMREVQILKPFRFSTLLWENQLQLVTRLQDELRAGLRTDADPVDTWRRQERPVGLDRDLEAPVVQGNDQLRVELEERLSTRTDNERAAPRLFSPSPQRYLRELMGSLEPTTTWAVRAYKIGIAPGCTSAGSPVTFAGTAAPQIATGEPKENRRSPDMHPFALKSVVDLFDRITHTIA